MVNSNISFINCVYYFDGEDLIGLIRVVGDDTSIIYIQYILVKEEYKRQGID